MVDLAKLDTIKGGNAGSRLTLRHPGTGEPLDAWIDLLGADSDAYREARDAQADRIANDAADRNGLPLTKRERDANGRDLLAVATKAWGNIEIDGKPVECNADNARMVYSRWLWAYEQVDKHVYDRANFIPAS